MGPDAKFLAYKEWGGEKLFDKSKLPPFLHLGPSQKWVSEEINLASTIVLVHLGCLTKNTVD